MLPLIPRQFRPPTRRGTFAAVGGALLCGLLAGLAVATATPAAAVNDAQSVSPAGGSVLTSAPGEVRIVFERTLFSPVTVKVSGPDGDAEQGAVQILGDTVVQPLKSRLSNGDYTISWAVAGFIDQSSGSSGFRIARKASRATAKPTPSPRPSPTPSPTPRASPTPKAKRTPAAVAAIPTETPPAAASYVAAPKVDGVAYTGSHDLPPPIVWWGLLLLLAVAGYLVKKQVDARRQAPQRMVQRMTPDRRSERRSQPPDADDPDADPYTDPYDGNHGRLL